MGMTKKEIAEKELRELMATETGREITPEEIENADAIFVSHSGGKDSQAMLALIKRMGLLEKCVLVHADLGEMEWEEMKPWIEKISFDLPCNVVESEEDFFEMCRRVKRLPSGQMQFCTDVLKTTPIAAFIHEYMYKNNLSTAINATGMRASESARRAKKSSRFYREGCAVLKSDMHQPRKHSEHTITDWMPIFYYTDEEVFTEIKNAGQVPHEIYSMGFSRLSCVFCINGRIAEHKEAAKLRPQLARKMADLEHELGRSLRLKQIKGVKHQKYLDEYCEIEMETPVNLLQIIAGEEVRLAA